MPWRALRRPVLRRGRRWRTLWRAWRIPKDAVWQRKDPSPVVAGLSPEQQQAAVEDACRRIEATPEGAIHSGLKRTGIGTKLRQADGSPAWLKITAKGGKTDHWHRRGEHIAQSIDGVPKPKILRELEWNHAGTDLHASSIPLCRRHPCSRRRGCRCRCPNSATPGSPISAFP
jgi:hypothetical protein